MLLRWYPGGGRSDTGVMTLTLLSILRPNTRPDLSPGEAGVFHHPPVTFIFLTLLSPLRTFSGHLKLFPREKINNPIACKYLYKIGIPPQFVAKMIICNFYLESTPQRKHNTDTCQPRPPHRSVDRAEKIKLRDRSWRPFYLEKMDCSLFLSKSQINEMSLRVENHWHLYITSTATIECFRLGSNSTYILEELIYCYVRLESGSDNCIKVVCTTTSPSLSVCCVLTAPAPDDILTIARKMADIDN